MGKFNERGNADISNPKCLCDDCGADCIEIGEYIILQPDAWQRNLGLRWSNNLCVGCIEKRLGRRLQPRDFLTWPRYSWTHPYSTRLLARMFGDCIRHWCRPYRILDFAAASLRMAPAEIERIGEYLKSESNDWVKQLGAYQDPETGDEVTAPHRSFVLIAGDWRRADGKFDVF